MAAPQNRPDTRPRYRRTASAALAIGLICTGAAQAQDAARKNVTLLGIPSATVAPTGLAFAALTGTTKRDGVVDEVDGSLALGFGLGSAEDGVGVQVALFNTSLTDNFGDSGYLQVKFSRRIAAGTMPTYVGVSLGQLANWGDASGRDVTAALAVTSFAQVHFKPGGEAYPVMMTAGIANNVRNNDRDPGVFLGAGIGLTESFGVSAAWSGEDVDIGGSLRIKGLKNVGLTATLNDAFDQNDSRRMTFSVFLAVPNAFGG